MIWEATGLLGRNGNMSREYPQDHYSDVRICVMASQIIGTSIFYSIVFFRRRSKKTSNLCVTGLCLGIHLWPVNSPHNGPIKRKMFPLDDIIMMGVSNFRSFDYFPGIAKDLAYGATTSVIVATSPSVIEKQNCYYVPLGKAAQPIAKAR